MWIANHFATFLSSLRTVFQLIRQKSQAPCDFFEAAVKPTVYRQSPTWQSWWSPLDWQVPRLYIHVQQYMQLIWAILYQGWVQWVQGCWQVDIDLRLCDVWRCLCTFELWWECCLLATPSCSLNGYMPQGVSPQNQQGLSICPWPWRKSYIGSNIWLFLSYEICRGLEDWFSCGTICSWFCSCFHGRKGISFHMTLVVALAPTTTLATPASRRVYEFSIFDTCLCEMMYFKFACPRCSRSLKIPFHAFERALRERSSRIFMEHNLVASSVHFHWPILFPGKDMEMLLDEAG